VGFAHLISLHRHLKITEEQRRRFVDLYVQALDNTQMPHRRGNRVPPGPASTHEAKLGIRAWYPSLVSELGIRGF